MEQGVAHINVVGGTMILPTLGFMVVHGDLIILCT